MGDSENSDIRGQLNEHQGIGKPREQRAADLQIDGQIEQARRDGFVQTLLGRRRYIPEVNSRDPMLRQVGERMAINAPVQGTAADLIKRAMVELAHTLQAQHLTSRMVLQVHDELILEVKKELADKVAALVKETMEQVTKLRVPIDVHVNIGKRWGELK